MLSLISLNIHAQSKIKATEYELMALFISHFPKYIEFPNNSAASNKTHIHIIGKSNLLPHLKKISEKSNSKFIISQSDSELEIPNVNILIIGENFTNNMFDILQSTKNQNLLIIGCYKGLEKKGASINFFTSGDKIKFKLSKKAIKINDLKVSAQLMKLAIIVD